MKKAEEFWGTREYLSILSFMSPEGKTVPSSSPSSYWGIRDESIWARVVFPLSPSPSTRTFSPLFTSIDMLEKRSGLSSPEY